MILDRIDHFVLTVASVDATIEFYQRVLGMQPITFAGGRRGLAFGDQKINLHPAGKPHEPRALEPMPGSADFCLISKTPIDDVIAHLTAQNVEIELGPVPKTGAMGDLVSVYFRDPDGNLVEISNYTDA